MSIFIISILLITLFVLWALTYSLRKPKDSSAYDRHAQNIHFAQQRLLELDTQLSNNAITNTDYDALKSEIEQTLADDIELGTKLKPHKTHHNKPLIIILAIMLPLGAVGLYALLGEPNVITPPTSIDNTSKVSADDVNHMLQKIEQHIQNHPDDIQGWTILANTYLSLGHYQDAIQANQQRLKLQGENADALASLADATALAQQGKLSGKPSEYLERALALQPMHPQSLWLMGLAALQQNKPKLARSYWQKLLPLMAGKQQQELKEIIQQSYATDARSAQTNTNKPLNKAQLTVSIDIDPTLASTVKPSDLVFVIAKAKQGPPAPLAIKRMTVADLPTTIVLNDSHAMIPKLAISKFANITVKARIAKSGNPIAQAGDIESTPIDVSNKHQETIVLDISTLVK